MTKPLPDQEPGSRPGPGPNIEYSVEDPLPPGWRRSKNRKGRAYYINDVNPKSTWIDPRLDLSKALADTRRTRRSIRPRGMTSTPFTGPLPPAWEMRKDEKDRLYFVNHNERMTTWNDPRANVGAWVHHARNIGKHGLTEWQMQKKIARMPKGWEMVPGMYGRMQFVNYHNKGITQWEDPRGPRNDLIGLNGEGKKLVSDGAVRTERLKSKL